MASRARTNGSKGSSGELSAAFDLWAKISLCFADSAHKALRSEEHTSELQSLAYLVCRLLLEKKKQQHIRRSEIRSLILPLTHSQSNCCGRAFCRYSRSLHDIPRRLSWRLNSPRQSPLLEPAE